jgi:phosphatidylethanolamine/phosphatidyl-N-methylethanolamine N-methyltransferase
VSQRTIIEPAGRSWSRGLAHARRQIRAPWVFVQEMISQPASVGAIWPSSRGLARSVASFVPCLGDGLVVELGGGTGAVTQALLQRGIAPGRLAVVESSRTFVRHLRARFPDLNVLEGSAAVLGDLLPNGHHIDAIVSSLPLRSLPAREAAAIVAWWGALVGSGGIVVQFTYDLRGGELLSLPGFVPVADEIVWANLPPARVLALKRCGVDGHREQAAPTHTESLGIARPC